MTCNVIIFRGKKQAILDSLAHTETSLPPRLSEWISEKMKLTVIMVLGFFVFVYQADHFLLVFLLCLLYLVYLASSRSPHYQNFLLGLSSQLNIFSSYYYKLCFLQSCLYYYAILNCILYWLILL